MVPPGLRKPSFSAAAIIDRAMRSLIDPPGFWLSNFRNSRHGPVSIFVTSTIGVLPIRSSSEPVGPVRTGVAARDIQRLRGISGRRLGAACLPDKPSGEGAGLWLYLWPEQEPDPWPPTASPK